MSFQGIGKSKPWMPGLHRSLVRAEEASFPEGVAA